MNTLKSENQNKVDSFLTELKTNNTIEQIAKYFRKEVAEVCKVVEKYIVILYNRNGAIKTIKIDFLETQSGIKIQQKHNFNNN